LTLIAGNARSSSRGASPRRSRSRTGSCAAARGPSRPARERGPRLGKNARISGRAGRSASGKGMGSEGKHVSPGGPRCKTLTTQDPPPERRCNAAHFRRRVAFRSARGGGCWGVAHGTPTFGLAHKTPLGFVIFSSHSLQIGEIVGAPQCRDWTRRRARVAGGRLRASVSAWNGGSQTLSRPASGGGLRTSASCPCPCAPSEADSS